jgi:hypothetical protein
MPLRRRLFLGDIQEGYYVFVVLVFKKLAPGIMHQDT